MTELPTELGDVPVAPVAPIAGSQGSGLGQNIRAYGAANVVPQIIAALSIPIFARRLGPAGFGQLELLTVVLSLVISACGDAFSSGFLKLWFGEVDEDERRALVRTTRHVATSFALVVAIIGALTAWVVSDLGSVVLGATLLAAVANVMARAATEVLRAQGRAWRCAAAAAGRSLAGAALAVVGLFVLKPSAAVVIIATAVGGVVAFSYANAGMRQPISPSVDRSRTRRRLLALCWPLIPAAMSAWSLMLIDRFVLSAMRTSATVGEYGAANRVVAVLFLFPYAVTAAWTPRGLELAATDPTAEPRERARLLPDLVVVTSLVGVALSAVSVPLVSIVLGSQYSEAASLIPILALSVVLFTMVSPAQVPLLAAGRTKLIAVISVAAALANLVGAIVLIALYDATGAAIATVIGFAVLAGGYVFAAQRVAPAEGAMAALGRVLLPACVVIPVQALLLSQHGSNWVIAGVALLYPAILWLCGVRYRPLLRRIGIGRTPA